MSENEIEIPDSINKSREKQVEKVSHPKTKLKTSQKPVFVTPVVNKKSRFEPEAISVEIPSHGYLYRGWVDDKEVADGTIRIRSMTLQEEKILTTDRLVQQGKALDMILENCIKSNINSYELLSSDRLYLLFYLRGMSYGLEYDFTVKCYHCGANFEQTIDIDKLPIKEWESVEEAQEPFSIQLPISNFVAETRFMRGKDESKLVESTRETKNFNQVDDDAGQAIVLLISKITTDDGEVLSPNDRADFINNMPAGDADFFRSTMKDRDCGIQMLDHIYCPRCNGQLEFNVPLGRNFFRRARR